MSVRFEPTPKQHKAFKYLDDPNVREVLYGGSSGGGKSYLACNWVIISCLRYPDTRYAICRSRFTSLAKTTLLTFQSLISKYKLDKYVKYNGTSHIFEFQNGSRVFFLDLYQNPSDYEFDSLRGYELTALIFDEAHEISLKAFDVLFGTRVRYNLDKYNLTPKILVCTNPCKNWVFTRYYIPWRDKTLPPHIKFIKSTCEDNPYLPVSYVDMLKNGSEINKQIYYLGNWSFDADLLNLFDHSNIVDSFYIKKIFTNDKYLTVDPAMDSGDDTVFTVWDGFNCTNIFKFQHMDTNIIVDKVKSYMTKYSINIQHVIVDKNGVGQGVFDLLKGCVGFMGAEKALKDEPYINIRTQMYYKLAEYFNNNNIYIECEPLLRDEVCQDLEAHKKVDTDKDAKAKITSKQEVKSMIGRSPGISDALSMRMWWVYNPKSSKPIFI